MSWEKVKLGDTATFINGYAFKPSDWSDSGKEIIRIQNLTKSSAECNYYSGSIADKYLVKKGDLLISWSATLGVYEWDSEDAWLNQHIFKVSFDKREVNKIFFKYLIQSKLNELEKQVHGATMKHITKGKFDNIDIELPPLHIQQHIADVLDKADALRQKDQLLLQKYDELAQSIFYDMFGDPVKNEKGWVVKDLIDCVTIRGGGTPSTSKAEYFDGDIPWVSPKDMKFTLITTSIDKITELAIKESSTTLIETNCVLMVVRSGILKKSLPLAINVVPVAINQDMKALKTKDSLNPYFLLYLLKALSVPILTSVRGTTADNISSDVIKKVQIILPELDNQIRFEQAIYKIFELKNNADITAKSSYSLFSSLLNKSFTLN